MVYGVLRRSSSCIVAELGVREWLGERLVVEGTRCVDRCVSWGGSSCCVIVAVLGVRGGLEERLVVEGAGCVGGCPQILMPRVFVPQGAPPVFMPQIFMA